MVSLSEFAPIAGCADVEALTAPEPLQVNPKRQQIEALQRRLSELRAAERLGKFATIVKEARAISDQAEQVGFRPLAAEAWFLLGELETSSGNRKAAAEALFRAALAGVAGHNLRAAAQAFSLLAADAGVERRSDDSLRYSSWPTRRWPVRKATRESARASLMRRACACFISSTTMKR